MRNLGPRAAALSATLLMLMASTAAVAYGDRVVETVYADGVPYYAPTGFVTTSSNYYVPTTSRYYVPSSMSTYVPTSASYYVPSGYTTYLPASATYYPSSYSTTAYTYLPSSYIVEPTYYATTYRRPGLLRRLASRPVIQTTRSYAYDSYPTVSYMPTTIAYDPSVVRTGYTYGVECNETTVPFSPPPAVPVDPNATSKSIQSRSREEAEPAFKPNDAATKAVIPPVKETPPPAGVAPDKDGMGAGGLSDPDPTPPKVGGPGATQDRSSFRPAFTEFRPRPNASAQPMLRGQVIGVGGVAKEGLEVVFADMRGTYKDRLTKTDAKGNFEQFLPNGTWSVRVVDPVAAAGTKPTVYGEITSTAGRYLDENDSPIVGLRLNY